MAMSSSTKKPQCTFKFILPINTNTAIDNKANTIVFHHHRTQLNAGDHDYPRRYIHNLRWMVLGPRSKKSLERVQLLHELCSILLWLRLEVCQQVLENSSSLQAVYSSKLNLWEEPFVEILDRKC